MRLNRQPACQTQTTLRLQPEPQPAQLLSHIGAENVLVWELTVPLRAARVHDWLLVQLSRKAVPLQFCGVEANGCIEHLHATLKSRLSRTKSVLGVLMLLVMQLQEEEV